LIDDDFLPDSVNQIAIVGVMSPVSFEKLPPSLMVAC
jgi:hypothetical protein